MRILADLHNHSCLSPCASLELSPALLARRGRERGLGLQALTDHNAALNCPAFEDCCRREGVAPLFGIEACSSEEVHVLCLFGSADEALGFGELLRGLLPPLPYDPEKLGDQVVVDADEEVLELPEYYLGAAVGLGFDGLCAEAARRGALVVPAHVDRPMFSVSSQLGFLPPGPYAAVESMREPAPELRLGLPVISGSDAHYPEHVGRRPFSVELPEELLAARLAARPGPEAERAGAELLAALAAALAARAIRPSWSLLPA
ncbi:MAG TPA: PHP domain-containing protein [Spirochaetales bacterium]|nr:PHP domain-containing protein [Spirochaetales bacterium]HRY53964.1 PHP domain-containing protein [Spirochaetia bacterium]